METAIVAARSAFPSQLVKAIICARGTEFDNWLQIEDRLHCEVYFADPYCAWQKGNIENLNGLLREFYPRGRNLSRVAPATLKRDLALLNAKPRKVLNFHSAQDWWDFEPASCCTWFDNSLPRAAQACARAGRQAEKSGFRTGIFRRFYSFSKLFSKKDKIHLDIKNRTWYYMKAVWQGSARTFKTAKQQKNPKKSSWQRGTDGI